MFLIGTYLDITSFSIHDAVTLAYYQRNIGNLPKSITKNSVFCVDLNFCDIKDVLADDNGAYRVYGNKVKHYEIKGCKSIIWILNTFLLAKNT